MLLGRYTVVDVAPGTHEFTPHAGEPGFDKYAAEIEQQLLSPR